ncbi:MAG: hypothetical protein RIA71_12535 [Oceanicaulis sp.]
MEKLEKKGLDAAWLAGQLRKDWRARLFLTDKEALGDEDQSSTDRKSRAKPHSGGVLSRFASAATLKRLQASGVVKAYPTARLDDNHKVAPGRSRAWPLREILKIELLLALAEMGDLPVFVLAELLDQLPGASQGRSLLDDVVDGWAGAVLADAGIHLGDAETRDEARALLAEGPAPDAAADRARDPMLVIVDRRWVLGGRLKLDFGVDIDDPEALADFNLFPLALIKSFKTGAADFEFVSEKVGRTSGGDFFWNEDWFATARQAHERSAARLELNLAEPLRRFINIHKLRDKHR